MRNDWHLITRRWIARLSFSFLAIAFFLAWDGYRRYQGAGPRGIDWRTFLDWFAAVISVVLAFVGMSERHRR